MASGARKRFASVEALQKFTPEWLRAFFLSCPDDVDSEDKFAAALEQDPLPYQTLVDFCMNKSGKRTHRFLTAIFYIDALATDGGMAQIKAQAKRDRVLIGAPDKCTAHDFAFFGWKANEQLLPRAFARGSARRKRSMITYQTDVESIPDWAKTFDKRKGTFEGEMDKHFLGDQQGEGTEIRSYPNDETTTESAGEVWFLIRRGGMFTRQGTIGKDLKSDYVEYVPELYDTAVYSPDFAELRVYAPPKERDAYRKAFGNLLGVGENFFSHAGLFTLEPLKTGKREAISLKGFEDKIKSVKLVELHYRMPGGGEEYFMHRAPDLFALAAGDPAATTDAKPLMPEGAVPERADLQLFFRDGAPPRTLCIIPTDLARYTRDDDAPIVEAWMRERKFKLSKMRPKA